MGRKNNARSKYKNRTEFSDLINEINNKNQIKDNVVKDIEKKES